MIIIGIAIAGFILLAFSLMFLNEIAQHYRRHPPEEKRESS